MKKILTMMGIAGLMCLAPSCKKSEVTPEKYTVGTQSLQDSAMLRVLLDSKPCTDKDNKYTSMTVDIRQIKVYSEENGWEELTPVDGAWDVISLQSAPVPVADITEASYIHPGTITKIAVTFGDNNHLVVGESAAACFNLSNKELVLDMKGDVKGGTRNQIVLSIDVCGNVSVSPHYDSDPCYTLNPVMAFESFSEIIEGKTAKL